MDLGGGIVLVRQVVVGAKRQEIEDVVVAWVFIDVMKL